VLLRGKDLRRTQGLYTLWLALWQETLSASPYGKSYSVKRWLSAIAREDVFDLLSECKTADEYLLEGLETGLCWDYDSFKRCLKKEINKDIVLIGMLKGLIAAWFESMDHRLLKALRTLLLYPTQLTLKSDTLSQQALEDYLSNEDRLRNHCAGYTLEERAILAAWFPARLKETFFACMAPHNGNGAVAQKDVHTPREKYECFATDARLEYLAKRVPGVAWAPQGELVRRARVAFVPKSYKAYRTISMEPAPLMYWQEGINTAFVTLLKAGAFGSFGRRYDPMREDLSRELAKAGSKDGSFATIDLSAASDSVAWDLVKEWYRDTCLYEALFCTRSVEAELPDGTILPLRKFAPMGSAVNFIVECGVFAAITAAAIKESGGDPERSAFRVFGDDIVVESRYAETVIARLERNGFVVNHTKTFRFGALGYFREACGGHYADDIDVSPLRASKFFEDFRLDFWKNPSTYLQVIDQCNTFYQNGYRLARGVLIHRLLSLPQQYRPLFVSADAVTNGVLSDTPHNDHLQAQWNFELQEWELKCGDVRVSSSQQPNDSTQYWLYEWLRRTLGRRKVDEPCHVDDPLKRYTARLISTQTSAFGISLGGEDPSSLPSLNATDLPGWQGGSAS
jgi:hypothetical protein